MVTPIFFIRKNLARHGGIACLAAWVVCVQACTGDSAPKVEQPEAITAGQPEKPLVGMSEALLTLNQAENTQKELEALSGQLDAVPAQTRDAHAEEYAEALAIMEGMLEKQQQVISEALSAAQNAGPTVAGDVAGEAAAKASVRLDEEQSETFRQCAQHTAEYRQLMQEIRNKMSKW
ncbi:MAG: hypothetical protein SFV52_13980 [Saprospiraceae bacterium]|nr:hypothetical protein [Saprospiraceae bacterium]